MLLFSGSSHPALASALAKQLGIKPGAIHLKRFSSGEAYVRFEQSVRGQSVYLLQAPGRRPDEYMFELFIMCQAAKLSFASSVHVLLPYFPYARQDRISQPREGISGKLMASLLEKAGADHVITLNLHSDQTQGFFNIPVDALDARPLFADYFRKKKLKEAIVVSPDIGGAKQAKKFADALGAELAIMNKVRPAHNQAAHLEIVGDVKGKTCILYDDMIDTAGTLTSAKEALLKNGALKGVYVAAVHAVFSGPAIERLEHAKFAEVVVTDSIPVEATFKGLKILPIAPLLGRVIEHHESGRSVTDMYKKN
jgi:ribose-phosphate pyrophosphokinase